MLFREISNSFINCQDQKENLLARYNVHIRTICIHHKIYYFFTTTFAIIAYKLQAKKMIAKEYITRYHVQEIQPMQRIVTHADVVNYKK